MRIQYTIQAVCSLNHLRLYHCLIYLKWFKNNEQITFYRLVIIITAIIKQDINKRIYCIIISNKSLHETYFQ